MKKTLLFITLLGFGLDHNLHATPVPLPADTAPTLVKAIAYAPKKADALLRQVIKDNPESVAELVAAVVAAHPAQAVHFAEVAIDASPAFRAEIIRAVVAVLSPDLAAKFTSAMAVTAARDTPASPGLTTPQPVDPSTVSRSG